LQAHLEVKERFLMKTIYLSLILAAFLETNSFAVTPEQFRAHADTVIDNFAKFDPVWGTCLGFHAYDDRLADLTPQNIKSFVKYLETENDGLLKIDAGNWQVDDQIDLKLLISNIRFLIFQYKDFPYWKKSPTFYSDQCLYSIYYITLRNYAPMEQKLPSIISRLNAIPGLCKTAQNNLTDPVPIFVETAVEAIDQGIKLINDVCQGYIDRFPEKEAEIQTARDNAVTSLRNFNVYCQGLKKTAHGSFAIGKSKLNMLLSDIHFLNLDCDSLLSLANNVYAQVDSEMGALETKLPPNEKPVRFTIPSINKADVLDYYQWEINRVKDFVGEKNLIDIPENFGDCVPVETPAFLRGIIRGIAYEPPAPFDSIQTGYFYVRPLPDTFTAEQKTNYTNYFEDRGFRGSVVHEAFPGHHLQLLLANQHPSKIRRIQQNNILIEGWALYCEEMVYKEGLYGENLRQWDGVLGGIRFRAVRIMVDVGLQTGKFTSESALAFMNSKLGEGTNYYTAEIRRYCANPTQALSYLTGKTLITRMYEHAAAREGQSFSRQEFYDKLLSEGSIPPGLIALKYGW
jgi:uncharacterized protein (DUF885 family)